MINRIQPHLIHANRIGFVERIDGTHLDSHSSVCGVRASTRFATYTWSHYTAQRRHYPWCRCFRGHHFTHLKFKRFFFLSFRFPLSLGSRQYATGIYVRRQPVKDNRNCVARHAVHLGFSVRFVVDFSSAVYEYVPFKMRLNYTVHIHTHTWTGASLFFGCYETYDKNHLTLFTIRYASLCVARCIYTFVENFVVSSRCLHFVFIHLLFGSVLRLFVCLFSHVEGKGKRKIALHIISNK